MANLILPSKDLLTKTANAHRFKDFNNPKTCVYCGSEFYHGRSDSISCGLCYIEYKCLSCNKIVSKKFRDFSGKTRKEMISMIKEDRLKEYSGYCSYTCSSKSRTGPGECYSCNKYVEKRSISFLCESCQLNASENGRKTNTASGFCLKCGNHSNKRNVNGYCFNCQREVLNKAADKNRSSGLCTRCGKYLKIRTRAGLCIDCVSEDTIKNNRLRNTPGLCLSCKKYFDKRNIFGVCYKCMKAGGSTFDREAFYKEKFNLISFDSLDQDISWDNIDSLKDIPGVWSVWASDNKCLDVCQTINIGREMLAWIRSYNACKDKTDEELIKMNIKHRRYNRKKKRDIAKYCSSLNTKPIFKVVSINIETKEQREAIESQYAHDNKAIFWNPGLGQKLTKGLHNKSAAFSNKIKI